MKESGKNKKRFICIHGHFYQPPRENPWLEEIELQDSAHPFHDWNQRITSECYAPNTAARILDAQGRISCIVNNYTRMSFNFGPTLLSWMERNDPVIHQAVVQADKASQKMFSGHGSAWAQCYNHMIMPLANAADKRTQVLWGVKDFEHRFGRSPEGMWLPETAVDLETLEIFSEMGIQFTVLAPNQAKAVRKIGETNWFDVRDSRIDPRRTYLCRLPSGRTINLFFYDGPISRDIAFGDLLFNGENFAKRLNGAFSEQMDEPQLVHISTDGETYGHHHHMGDMALAYCLRHFEDGSLAKITNYGEFCEKHPPTYEVEIFEDSSWSCIHGVERWQSNCGCNSGMHPQWHQGWRRPLREALEWLRESLILIFEDKGSVFFKDAWKARDDYIQVILNRSRDSVEDFFSRHGKYRLTEQDKSHALHLLEIQRNAMLMFTSCGWFFDEISGIETVQVMQYAARAIQLAQKISELNLERMFVHLLKRAPSNIPEFKNGAEIYDRFVRRAVLDLVRVGAHYAVSSLFETYKDKTKIYCYTATTHAYDCVQEGKGRLAVGEVTLVSDITWESRTVNFAILHLGDHHLIGGVRALEDDKVFAKAHQEMKDAFKDGKVEQVAALIEQHYQHGLYSLEHLFRDEQCKILYQILDLTLIDVEASLRQINEHHYPIIQVLKQLHIPLPKVLINTVLVMVNTDILRVLGSEQPDFHRLEELVAEVREWSLELDKPTLSFVARRRITELMEEFEKRFQDFNLLSTMEKLLGSIMPLELNLDLWKAQNIYFSLSKTVYPEQKKKAQGEDSPVKEWVAAFDRLGQYLKVIVQEG